MSLFEFKESDVFFNVMKTHPKCEFFIYDKKVYYNNNEHISGAFCENVLLVPNGFVSLYEMNIDRNPGSTGLIYPFITKDGTRSTFKTTSTENFNTQFAYGDTLSGSYPLSASITRYYFDGTSRKRIDALRNVLDYHARLSPHYRYSSSYGDKSLQTINLVSVPSIFYGSSIDKGTLSMKFYMTGALIGELRDERKNGELIQVGPTGSNGSGSVAGVVLYDEGFVLLTGSWKLNPADIDYISDPSDIQKSSWLFFGVGANDNSTANSTISSASYTFNFDGTEKIPTLTMLAHAEKSRLNFSNNPTFIDFSSSYKPTDILSSSTSFKQGRQIIKNTVSSSYPDPEAEFEKQVFITKVGIYDENKNLIAIASLANPVKKGENDDYTFKLKLDL